VLVEHGLDGLDGFRIHPVQAPQKIWRHSTHPIS
jgi:hypothetical protein